MGFFERISTGCKQFLGYTQGFLKVVIGQPQKDLLRQLWIVNHKSEPRKVNMESARKFSATEAKSLYKYFQAMVDLRRKRGGRHPLAAPLPLIVLAEMCSEDKPMA